MEQKERAAMVPSLTSRLAEALLLVDTVIAETVTQLAEMPDNPKITRVGTDVRAFRISSADVFASNKWDPFFHDGLLQYGYAKELMESRRFAALRILLQAQTHLDPSHGRRTFAPEVIARLKEVTGDLLIAERILGVGALDKPIGAARKDATGKLGQRRRP